MKFVVAVLIFVIAFIMYLWPFVSREKVCFENAQKMTADIQQTIVVQAFSRAAVCKSRAEVLEGLEQCIKQATISGLFTQYTYPIIEGAVSLVRPLGMGIFTLKSELSLECQ